MNCILTVARLTVVESLRKRIFLALVGFAAAFVVVASFLPSMSAAARVTLLQAWAYRLVLFFGVLVALMLAAFSMPEDVETRRIQTLLVKPIRRTDVMLGKFAGFLGVILAFVLLMGLSSLALIRVVGVFGGVEAESALDPDMLIRASAFDPSPSARAIEYASRPGIQHRVEGPLEESLRWRFDGVTPGRFGEWVTVRLRVRLGLLQPDPMMRGNAQTVALVVEPDGPGGGKALSNPVRLWTWRWATVTLPTSAAGPNGTIWIRLVRPHPATWMSADADSVQLLLPGGPLSLEANFARALVLVFIQVGIVLGVTLAFSLFASSLVSLLAGFVFFLIGSLAGFSRASLFTSEQVLRHMREQAEKAGHAHAQGELLPAWLIDTANGINKAILFVIPDLSRLDYASHLAVGHAVPMLDLFGWGDAMRFTVYLVGPLLLACLVARRKEYA